MSRLYATIESDTRKTEPSSRGHRTITTHAATWSGAIRVDLETDEHGSIIYEVAIVPWRGSDTDRRVIERGTLEHAPAKAG